MKIYLAGPSAELARVREAAALIEGAGHELTERWWEKVDDTGTCASDVDHNEDELYLAAKDNDDGIFSADGVIALCKTVGGISPGTAHEVGYAQGLGMPVAIVGDPKGHLAARGAWGEGCTKPIRAADVETAVRGLDRHLYEASL